MQEFEAEFRGEPFDLDAAYNMLPKSQIPIIRQDGDQRILKLAQWWFVPSWWKTPDYPFTTFNAKSEEIASKPTFRGAIKRQRCLIPADGFFEWTGERTKDKRKWFIHRRDDKPFAFAGVWDHWGEGDSYFESCSLLTSAPAPWFEKFHDRQAVILSPKDYEIWLDPKMDDPANLNYLYEPWGEDELEIYEVRRDKRGDNGPDLIERLAN